MWIQKEISLNPRPRGFHLITNEILQNIQEIGDISIGTMEIFIKHTSASLTINEDADPTVRDDFESHFNQIVPENAPYYKHTIEGPDDMPSHLKSSILGLISHDSHYKWHTKLGHLAGNLFMRTPKSR